MNLAPRRPPLTGDDLALSRLRREAGRCVACGLCLPHCPTYRKTLSEADSPRGRIFMMAAALDGKLAFTPELVAHLDLCLSCRACEAACPSQVRYGELVDGVRTRIEPLRWRPPLQRALRYILFQTLARPRLLAGSGRLLRFYQRSGLQFWLRKSRLLQGFKLDRAEARLPALRYDFPAAGIHRANGASLGTVGLFLGCVARLADAETLRAAVFLLTRLGYDVLVAPRQTCCGALHRHQGDAARAARLARENREAFAQPPMLAVLHAASACGATLAEYDPPLGAPVLDISTFLVAAPGWERLTPAPLAATIAVHEPCLGRNVLHDQGAVYALLGRIPGITVIALAGNDQCCGAAGIYAVTQPEMAQALLRDKINAIRSGGASIVATSNPGCAMHIAAGLRAEGLALEVTHPVALLARQLGFAND